MPMKNPPHPGEFIRTEIIEPTALSVTAAATVLQVSRPALSSLLNGKANLSGEMALRIEKAFGVKVETVRTLICRGRYFRKQMKLGPPKHWKKALVTLKQGEKIALFEGA